MCSRSDADTHILTLQSLYRAPSPGKMTTPWGECLLKRLKWPVFTFFLPGSTEPLRKLSLRVSGATLLLCSKTAEEGEVGGQLCAPIVCLCHQRSQFASQFLAVSLNQDHNSSNASVKWLNFFKLHQTWFNVELNGQRKLILWPWSLFISQFVCISREELSNSIW